MRFAVVLGIGCEFVLLLILITLFGVLFTLGWILLFCFGFERVSWILVVLLAFGGFVVLVFRVVGGSLGCVLVEGLV